MIINPKQRLGTNGASEVKGHPFFAGLNWSKLAIRKITPPFIPEVKDGKDLKYFDQVHTTYVVKHNFVLN